jgi:hypothetical protein
MEYRSYQSGRTCRADLLGKLVDYLDKHVFSDEFKVADEPRECPPGRRPLEAELSPNIFVVESSLHRVWTVDIVVEAVKDAFQ